MTEQPTLDLAEAVALCAKLGRSDVTPKMLRTRAQRGTIPSFFDGGKLHFVRSAIVAAVQDGAL